MLPGQAGVMGQEIHRHLRLLGHLPQGVGIPLDVLSRTGKDEIGSSPQSFKQVLGDRFLRRFAITFGASDVPAKLDSHFTSVRRALQEVHSIGVSRPEVLFHRLHVGKGGRQPNSADATSHCQLQTREERPQVNAPFIVQKRMQLVDDDCPGAGEQRRDFQPPEHEQRFQRLRRDQQDAPRVPAGARLHPL